MPYCSNCGAYIPDGETKCVACGSVNYAGTGASSAYASAQSSADNVKWEDKQSSQKQKNAEWAKQAYEEYKNSGAYKENESAYSKTNSTSSHGVASPSSHTTSGRTGGTPSAKKGDGTVSQSTSKILAALSYISGLFVLPFIFAPNDKFSRFHAKQGLLVFILSIIADIITKFAGLLGAVLSIFRIYLIIMGIRNVINDKMEELPYIGKYADRF